MLLPSSSLPKVLELKGYMRMQFADFGPTSIKEVLTCVERRNFYAYIPNCYIDCLNLDAVVIVERTNDGVIIERKELDSIKPPYFVG